MIPPPSYVAQVWLTEGGLSVHFPQANDGKGHTIYLSGDIYGLTCMLQILQERMKNGPYTVGHKSTPTQWQIDREIKRLRGNMPEEIKEVARAKKIANFTRAEHEALRRGQEVEARRERKRREAEELLRELGL